MVSMRRASGPPRIREIDMAAMEFLNRGEFLRFSGAAGIRVLEGNVWVTHERDATDYVVGRSGAMDLAKRGLTIVSATEPTLLELYRADPAGVRCSIQRRAEMAQSRELFDAIRGAVGRLFGR